MSKRILEGSLVQTHTFVTAGGLSLVQSSAWDQLGRLVFFFFFFYYLDTFCLTDVSHTASGTTCLCIVIKTNKKKRLPPERKDEQGHGKFGPLVLNSAELNQKSKICWKEIMTKLVPRIPVSAFFCVRDCRTKMYSGFFE